MKLLTLLNPRSWFSSGQRGPLSSLQQTSSLGASHSVPSKHYPRHSFAAFSPLRIIEHRTETSFRESSNCPR